MAGGLLVKRDVRPSHDVTSYRYANLLTNSFRRRNAIRHKAHPAARISQYDNSHPTTVWRPRRSAIR